MKKIFLGLTVISAFTLVSCKKDRVCSCTQTSTAPNSTSQVIDVTLEKARKSDAKKLCVKTTHDSNGYTTTSDCKLK